MIAFKQNDNNITNVILCRLKNGKYIKTIRCCSLRSCIDSMQQLHIDMVIAYTFNKLTNSNKPNPKPIHNNNKTSKES